MIIQVTTWVIMAFCFYIELLDVNQWLFVNCWWLMCHELIVVRLTGF